jgi:pimeloyl-ACP methyl ester carboxylesterase
LPEVRTNGISMYYELRGEGPPLVLVGGLGCEGAFWDGHVEAYERDFECVIPDNRGAGRSSKPPGPYTTGMMADDTIGLMEALDLGPAHVAGISMGGTIAQETAIRRPDLVRSLVLTSTWPKTEPFTARIFEGFKWLARHAEPRTVLRVIQTWLFTSAYAATHLDDILEMERRALESPHPMPPEAFAAQCDACIAHDALARLAGVTAPTLVTSGRRDLLTPLRSAEAIAARVPDSELVVFEEGCHAHHTEFLEEYNARTAAFLKAH